LAKLTFSEQQAEPGDPRRRRDVLRGRHWRREGREEWQQDRLRDDDYGRRHRLTNTDSTTGFQVKNSGSSPALVDP